MVRLLHLRNAWRVIAKYFFSTSPPNVGFIFALLAFAAGFAVRPFGALIFGRLGDMIGRKYTFLITMTIMGVGTFFVGLLPGYATSGIAAPVLLIVLRLLQGLALGGEYGGAAIYVAEHARQDKRGYYTSWIQTTATLGLFMSLLLILVIRTGWAKKASAIWGWRIPFLLSIILLGVSIWIRLQPGRVADVPEDEGRGHEVEGATGRSIRRVAECQDRDSCAVRRDRRRSRGVVWRTVLCAVLPDPDPQGPGG